MKKKLKNMPLNSPLNEKERDNFNTKRFPEIKFVVAFIKPKRCKKN
jgi:hypothetical protein